MRLTNNIRDAIVRSVINDIPTVNYYEQEAAIRKAAVRRAIPDKLKAIYDDKELRNYLRNDYSTSWLKTANGRSRSISYPEAAKGWKYSEAEKKRLKRLQEKHSAQEEKIEKARRSLEAAVYAFTTAKQLREAMPELAKYLPKEDEKLRTLPAVTEVVSNLKEAGWKGKKAA